jgi:CBS domain-containing protein
MSTPLPEFIIYNLIKEWADEVNRSGIKGDWIGIDNEEITKITTRMPPVKVGFTYPMTDTELPFISLVPEATSPVEQVLGRVIEEDETKRVYGVITRADIRVFVLTNNPETTIVLSEALYEYLLGKINYLIENGLTEPEMSMATLSAWSAVLPNIGFRREISISVLYETRYVEELKPVGTYDLKILDSRGSVVVEYEK